MKIIEAVNPANERALRAELSNLLEKYIEQIDDELLRRVLRLSKRGAVQSAINSIKLEMMKKKYYDN